MDSFQVCTMCGLRPNASSSPESGRLRHTRCLDHQQRCPSASVRSGCPVEDPGDEKLALLVGESAWVRSPGVTSSSRRSAAILDRLWRTVSRECRAPARLVGFGARQPSRSSRAKLPTTAYATSPAMSVVHDRTAPMTMASDSVSPHLQPPMN